MHPTTAMSAGLLVLRLLVGGASLAAAFTGAGRFSIDAALDLARILRAAGTWTRDSTRHSPRRQQALYDRRLTT